MGFQDDLPSLSVPEEDPSWRLEALCRGSSVNNFFRKKGAGTENGYVRERLICVVCPVREQCLEFALENHIPEGFFGGKTHRQRQAINMGRASKDITMSQVIKDLKKMRRLNPIKEASKMFLISEKEVRERIASEKVIK